MQLLNYDDYYEALLNRNRIYKSSKVARNNVDRTVIECIVCNLSICLFEKDVDNATN